jgi:hypothetical protein
MSAPTAHIPPLSPPTHQHTVANLFTHQHNTTQGCYRLLTEEEYAAEVTQWEPLGECVPSIPPAWPAVPPSIATTTAAALYHSRPEDGEGDGDGEDVRVITSPGQLSLSSSSSTGPNHTKAAGGMGDGRPLQPSSSTNTLIPALSAPTTPFSSQDGTSYAATAATSATATSTARGGRAQSHQLPPTPTPTPTQQLQPAHGAGAAADAGLPLPVPGAREQRALSHQPSSAAASSNSLVGLAGAGIGGSAAPSPFSSSRGGAGALLAPSSSSASASLSAGVEEKKEGGLQEEGTTLASYDYDVREKGKGKAVDFEIGDAHACMHWCALVCDDDALTSPPSIPFHPPPTPSGGTRRGRSGCGPRRRRRRRWRVWRRSRRPRTWTPSTTGPRTPRPSGVLLLFGF